MCLPSWFVNYYFFNRLSVKVHYITSHQRATLPHCGTTSLLIAAAPYLARMTDVPPSLSGQIRAFPREQRQVFIWGTVMHRYKQISTDLWTDLCFLSPCSSLLSAGTARIAKSRQGGNLTYVWDTRRDSILNHDKNWTAHRSPGCLLDSTLVWAFTAAYMKKKKRVSDSEVERVLSVGVSLFVFVRVCFSKAVCHSRCFLLLHVCSSAQFEPQCSFGSVLKFYDLRLSWNFGAVLLKSIVSVPNTNVSVLMLTF